MPFPDRLDLSAEHVRLARRHGVKFSIDSDAHAVGHLAVMRYGIGTAQRGWLEPGRRDQHLAVAAADGVLAGQAGNLARSALAVPRAR